MGLSDWFRPKPKTLLDALQSLPEFQQQKELFDAMSAMCEDGTDQDEMPEASGEFGLTATNPIPCRTIFGSTAYLGRLRAADGAKVVYERQGSTNSPLSPYPVDMYEIAHPDGQKLAVLYISPHQKRISAKAPRGFMLAENSGAQVTPVTEMVTEPDGSVKYFTCGVLHRDDGPAEIEVYQGYSGPEHHRRWYRFGLLDRQDGPAVIGGRTVNGQYEWWRAGVRHREDGPAVIELLDSDLYGGGPVYEWWLNGIQQKVQDADGILYYFKDGENVLTELPDGCRIIERDNEYRCEDADGNEQEDVPCLDSYEGYFEDNECAHPLYVEPQSTFDTFNPEIKDGAADEDYQTDEEYEDDEESVDDEEGGNDEEDEVGEDDIAAAPANELEYVERFVKNSDEFEILRSLTPDAHLDAFAKRMVLFSQQFRSKEGADTPQKLWEALQKLNTIYAEGVLPAMEEHGGWKNLAAMPSDFKDLVFKTLGLILIYKELLINRYHHREAKELFSTIEGGQ